MSVLNMQFAQVFNALMMAGNRWGVMEQTLGATFAVPVNAPHILALDPGGAGRNVTLPASPKKGDFFIIINTADAAEVLTVQDSAGGALTPACTPTQNETAFVVYINATLGWRNFVALGA